ncbi:MAG: choice-of-anchor J domain-containing protein [Gelidibacter sp.]|nr:choice-of-anchor J domain-containing protein [Gelidibacter sp.]
MLITNLLTILNQFNLKKITILIFVLFVFSWQSNAQFTQGFETGIPATWTVINGGDANTWTATTPGTGTAHTGTNVAKLVFGATAHDDYLITEQFTVTAGVSDRLSLWHKQRSNTFPEPFDVLLSAGGNTAPDFTITIAAAVASNTTWQQKTYDLTAYIGGTVYIAFRSTTTDQWELY